MTEPEDFLTRWSRRKRDATVENEPAIEAEAKPQRISKSEVEAGSEAKAMRPADAEPGIDSLEDVFDLSKLPSLDSIGPATDIRAFLQKGVPEALSRAALRRAWSADPGIRDFIGLAENSWDFTAKDGMHGFGEIDPADAKRLLAQLFSEGEKSGQLKAEDETSDEATEVAINNAEVPQDEALQSDITGTAEADATTSEPVSDQENEMLHGNGMPNEPVALQQKEAKAVHTTSAPMPRAHGRALPQ
jgi:hypothetical protein